MDILEACGASDSGSNPDAGVSLASLDNYFKRIDAEGTTEHHRKAVKKWVQEYVDFCGGNISYDKTLEYLNDLKRFDPCTQQKRIVQVKKFLRFHDYDFLRKLPKTSAKKYTPENLTMQNFSDVIVQFEHDAMMKACLSIGVFAGLRPSEICALSEESLSDIDSGIIHVGKAKTSANRDCPCNRETIEAVRNYLSERTLKASSTKLFDEQAIRHHLEGSGFLLKQARHIFIREALIVRGMNNSILKTIIGHSVGKDIMLSHYAFIQFSDIKKEYDRCFP